MPIVYSCNNIPIRLTDERWQHIVERHPEMATQRERVLETVSRPEMIQQGDYGELLAIHFYHKTPLTQKYLVVVYKEIGVDDGFIITAYFTTQPSVRRIVLWKR